MSRPLHKPNRENNSLAIHLHTLALMGDERWQEAIDTLQRMLAIVEQPKERPGIYQNLAVCYRALERSDEALAALDEAERLAPGQPDIVFARSVILASAARIPEAIAALKPLLPGLLKRPRHPQAQDFLRDLRRIQQKGSSPHTVHVDYLHAQIDDNIELGDMDRVESKARRMIELDPGRAEGHFSLGNALETQGRRQEALEAFLAAQALDPDNPPTLYNIGFCYVKLEQPAEAIAWLERALHHDPEHRAACLYLGIASDQLGQRQQAIKWWQRALQISPGYYAAQDHLHKVGAGPEAQEAPPSPHNQQYRRMAPLVKRRMRQRQVARNGSVTLTWDPGVGYVLDDEENPHNFSLYAGGPFYGATPGDEEILDVMGAVKLCLTQISASDTRDVAVLVYYPDGSVFNYQAKFASGERSDFITDGRFDVTIVPRLFKLRMDSDLITPIGSPMKGVLIYVNQRRKPGILTSTLGVLPKK